MNYASDARYGPIADAAFSQQAVALDSTNLASVRVVSINHATVASPEVVRYGLRSAHHNRNEAHEDQRAMQHESILSCLARTA